MLQIANHLYAAASTLLAAAPSAPAGGAGAGHGAAGPVLDLGAAPALPAYYLLIPGLPLVGFVLMALCAVFKVRSKLPAFLTVAGLAGAFALTLLLYLDLTGGGGPAHGLLHAFDWIRLDLGLGGGGGGGGAREFVANVSFFVDPLTCLWMLFVTGLATCIALYASEYMSHDVGPGYCRFFAAFNLFVLSMTCLVMGDNLIMLYLGWEGVGLCSYLLIGYFYKKPSAVAAGKKAFIMNRIGDLGLALGIMLTFVWFGTVQYKELFPALQPYLEMVKAGRLADIPWQVQLIPVLFTVGAFGKSAQVPLYVWLPDAMEGPTPVSALIHAATMVTAGVYLVVRFIPLYQCSEWALPIVVWGGTLTALLAATIGMAQFDIKRIMAYSTVSQLGYMFAGAGLLTTAGGAFHVFTHAFFKATLFLACGAVMHGFAGQLDLRKLSGVMKMKGWLVVGLAMLVGCLNLAGFPFTAGYFSKDMILAEAFTNTAGPGYAAVGWLLLLTAGLTAYYTFRVFFRVFVGPQHAEPGEEAHGHDAAHGHDGADHGMAAHGHTAPGPNPQHVDAESKLGGSHGSGAHADAQGGHGHGGGHGHDFHPHPPGWAINLVLAVLALGSILAAAAYPTHWVEGLVSTSTGAVTVAGEAPHGTIFGFDPHKAMYYVSAVVGAVGILIAAFLHGPRGLAGLFLGARTTAATSRADALVPALGVVAHAARRKWYVDEVYGFVIYTPLLVLSHILHLVDKLLVDGLVNAFGAAPAAAGGGLRPSQSGVLHGYAVGMAAGLAMFVLFALLVMN